MADPILVAWMPAGSHEQEAEVIFTSEVKAIDTASGTVTAHGPGEPFILTDTPMFLTSVPAEVVKQAQTNAGTNFP